MKWLCCAAWCVNCVGQRGATARNLRLSCSTPLGSSRSSQQSPGWGRPLRLLLRLVLMGVGLGVITGSALKLAGPAVQRGDLTLPSWLTPKVPATKDVQGEPEDAVINPPSSTDTLGRFETKQELTALSKRWEALAAQDPDLKVSAFMLALDDGRYAQLNPDTALPAAGPSLW